MNLRLRLEAVCGPGRVRGDGPLRISPVNEAALQAALAVLAEAGTRLTLEGLEGECPELTLSLEAFTSFELDRESHLLRVGAGLSVSALEQKLLEQRFSLRWGHLPPVPVGVWLAVHAGGVHNPRALPGHGPVAGLRAVLLDGTPLSIGQAPRSATGPDLLHFFLGVRARFGVMTGITLRVHPRPSETRVLAWSFADHVDAVASLVALLDADLWPDAMSLVDAGGAVRLHWALSGEAPTVELQASSAQIIARAGGASLLDRADGGPLGASEVRAAVGCRTSAGTAGARAWVRYSQIEPLNARLRAELPLAHLHLEAVAHEGAAAWIVGAEPSRLQGILAELGVSSATASSDLAFLDAVAEGEVSS